MRILILCAFVLLATACVGESYVLCNTDIGNCGLDAFVLRDARDSAAEPTDRPSLDIANDEAPVGDISPAMDAPPPECNVDNLDERMCRVCNRLYCEGRCVRRSRDNCTACGISCPVGNDCCDGACLSLNTIGHCGRCSNGCPTRPNATAVCNPGSPGSNCGIQCSAGFGDCDGDSTNGCEVNLQNNAASCGRCETACRFANATANCAAGVCVLGACNGGYENCDGMSMNGCEGAIGASCTVGMGACRRTGNFACVRGSAACNATAGTAVMEICDNIDNDCDGMTDETLTRPCYSGPLGTSGVGTCRPGAQTCMAGLWGSTCPGETVPRLERCDSTDDDCNGAVDNGFTVGRTCSVGRGSCARTGVFVCDSAQTGVTCMATPGMPSLEVPNNLDDDCDGLVDEGFCHIASRWFPNGTSNPSNACQRCDALDSADAPTTWTNVANGSSCLDGNMCSNGLCCGAGTANCDENPGNTCETRLNSNRNCGACNRACPASSYCDSGTCRCNIACIRLCAGGLICCECV